MGKLTSGALKLMNHAGAQRGRWQRASRAASAVLMLGVWVLGVQVGQAQPAAGEASGAAGVAPGSPVGSHEALANRYAADALQSFVIGLVRGTEELSPQVYERSALGLAAASAMVPDDAEMVRLELQAWDSTGNLARATEAAERLLALDPWDTVAQLRVINARIRRLPTAEARLAVYERLLREGAAGRGGIPEEVRSRLALDAALMAREVDADEIRFIDFLTTATSLDVTNKEAAALFATHFLDRTRDASERVDLLTNLVLADPMDEVALRGLAGELLGHGAYEGALRWFNLAMGATARWGSESDDDLMFNQIVAMWQVDGPLAAREILQRYRHRVYQDLQRRRARLAAMGEDPGPDIPPLLPYRLELVNLGIDAALRDTERLQAGLERVSVWARLTGDQLRDAERQMLEAAETDERRRLVEASTRNALASLDVELLYAHLVTGLDMDRCERLLDELVARRSELTGEDGGELLPNGERLDAVLDERAERRFRGWIAVHRDQEELAEELLGELAEEGDSGARLGLATLAERRRRIEEAQLHYARLVQQDPSTMMAAVALTRLENLLGRPVTPTALQSRLNEKALEVAPWMESIVSGASPITALTARFVPLTIDPLERAQVEIRMRNATRFPMGVGEDRPIGSRLILLTRLVMPTLTAEQQAALARLVSPEVVSAARRLRLGPNEEIVIRVFIGRGLTGQTLRQLSAHPATATVRVLQSFALSEDGSFEEAPFASSAQTDVLTRQAMDTRESAETLSDRILFAEGRSLLTDLYSAFYRLNLLVAVAASGELSPEQDRARSALRGALLERSATLGVMERRFVAALALQWLPLTDEWGQRLRAALETDDAATLVLLAIASRAAREDPIYARIQEVDAAGGAFAEFGELLSRLRTRDDGSGEGGEASDDGGASESGAGGR